MSKYYELKEKLIKIMLERIWNRKIKYFKKVFQKVINK